MSLDSCQYTFDTRIRRPRCNHDTNFSRHYDVLIIVHVLNTLPESRGSSRAQTGKTLFKDISLTLLEPRSSVERNLTKQYNENPRRIRSSNKNPLYHNFKIQGW